MYSAIFPQVSSFHKLEDIIGLNFQNKETLSSADELERKTKVSTLEYYLALPIQCLDQLAKQNSEFVYGAASMTSAMPGSFTEPIADTILQKLGAQFVLIGTAYSRKLDEQNNEAIRLKILKAIEAKISINIMLSLNSLNGRELRDTVCVKKVD